MSERADVSWLVERLQGGGPREAIVWRDRSYTYDWLVNRIHTVSAELDTRQVKPGDIVAVVGDFSPNATALVLALALRANVLVPLSSAAALEQRAFLEIAEVGHVITVVDDDRLDIATRGVPVRHDLLRQLGQRGAPGLVLFSSGSTGQHKAAVHDLSLLLDKFRVSRHTLRTIAFLMFDHIGGINTLFYALANLGTVVTVSSRTPEAVCEAIQRHRVELLPTSPTFLNLLLLSEAHRVFDVSSLRMITYGTEVMPDTTLRRLREEFPAVRLMQTYGLSEVGILRAKSRDDGSLWVRVGGEGYETRVVDGVLHVRARSAMLGYLNAPSPFDPDGWLNTGDAVEVDGEWLRILGRGSEIINVGGQKVYPAEVESALLQMPNIADVTVFGEKNAILGNIVVARVTLEQPETQKAFMGRLREFCRPRLATYKIPQRVVLVEKPQHNYRYKKVRRANSA